MTTGTQGFITLMHNNSNTMIMAFFQYNNAITYANLTQLAQAGGTQQTSTPATPNTSTAGTVGMSIQLYQPSGNTTAYIQAKTTSGAGNVYWYVTLV